MLNNRKKCNTNQIKLLTILEKNLKNILLALDAIIKH